MIGVLQKGSSNGRLRIGDGNIDFMKWRKVKIRSNGSVDVAAAFSRFYYPCL